MQILEKCLGPSKKGVATGPGPRVASGRSGPHHSPSPFLTTWIELLASLNQNLKRWIGLPRHSPSKEGKRDKQPSILFPWSVSVVRRPLAVKVAKLD